jgi:hypothetical protein
MSRSAQVLRVLLITGLLAGSMPLLTGCAGLVSTAAPGAPIVSSGSITGVLHGGNQAVSGATVSLYAVGTSSYGTGAVLYAQTTSLNDGMGTFQFTQTTGTSPTGPPTTISKTYACPTGSTTNPNPEMYILAKGGSTQGSGNGTNSAAAFIVAIGPCASAGSLYLDMNEVTSVGTMAALQQYFNPVTESLGYPSADLTYFQNGRQAIGTLVNLATGAPVTSSTKSGIPSGATGSVTVTITPEVAQINTIADILAACVNNASSSSTSVAANCATLFADAVPPDPTVTSQPANDFTTVTAASEDTVQALYFMLTDPASGLLSSNMDGLFGLVSTVPPFQPAYGTANQPTDWTIAVSYSSSTACAFSTGQGTGTTAKFLNGINDPAVDAAGNVWSTSTGTGGGLFEISPLGSPMTCGLGTMAANVSAMTLDENGNPWVGSTTKSGATTPSYQLYKWSSVNSALDSAWPTSTSYSPLAIAGDGSANLFYTDSNGGVSEFAGAAAASAAVAAPTAVAALETTADAIYMQADSSGDLWIPATVQGNPGTLYEVYPSTGTGNSNGFLTTANTVAALYEPYGLAIGATDIYLSNGAGSGGSGNSFKWDYVVPNATAGGAATITNSAGKQPRLYRQLGTGDTVERNRAILRSRNQRHGNRTLGHIRHGNGCLQCEHWRLPEAFCILRLRRAWHQYRWHRQRVGGPE